MNTQDAITTLQASIASKNSDVAVLQMALEILQGSFKTEDTALATTYQAKIDDLNTQLTQAQTDRDTNATNLATVNATVSTAQFQVAQLLSANNFPDYDTFQLALAAGYTNNKDYQASIVSPAEVM